MKFIPKKSKFKKSHKGKAFNKINSKILLNQLNTGIVGLKAVTHSHLTDKQIETLYRSLNKIIKKTGQIKLKIFSNIPVTKKATGVRMGKGKGVVDHWIFKTKPGCVLCEIQTNNLNIAIKALKYSKIKLPIKTKIIFN